MGVYVVIIGYLSTLLSYSSPISPSGSLMRSSWGTMLCDICWIHSLTELFLLSVIASQRRTDTLQLAEYERVLEGMLKLVLDPWG